MFRRLLAILLAGAFLPGAAAHELAGNRLTLVLRDEGHVTMTFFVDYPEALRRALAPQASLQEFVLAHAALEPPAFEKALARAQARFQGGTRLATEAGASAVTWHWPEPARVQAALRERAMQAIVDPDEHGHGGETQIRAEAVARGRVASLTLSLPAEFGRTLVVSYRPRQDWVEPGKAPLTIDFEPARLPRRIFP